MKSNRNRLWIIILGGVIGLALGVVLSSFYVGNRWERLSYPALASAKDRAIELSWILTLMEPYTSKVNLKQSTPVLLIPSTRTLTVMMATATTEPKR